MKLILFLLLSLIKEAIHDASSDEHTAYNSLGQYQHGLIFHLVRMSLIHFIYCDCKKYNNTKYESSPCSGAQVLQDIKLSLCTINTGWCDRLTFLDTSTTVLSSQINRRVTSVT